METVHHPLRTIKYPRENKDNPDQHFAPFEFKQYNAGQKIVFDQHSASHLYYLEKGLVKCEDSDNGKIIWFELEKNYFTLPESFINAVKSKYEIIALESCFLYRISREDLQYLIEDDNTIARWWIKTLEKQYSRLYDYYSLTSMTNARQKYYGLRTLLPGIESRIKVKDLALFLGIAPESLSRIRSLSKFKDDKRS